MLPYKISRMIRSLYNVPNKRVCFYCRSYSSIRKTPKQQIKEWFASDIISDRKSYFQARHTELNDKDDIPEILDQFLSQHKNIAKSASHPHMIAWRTGAPIKTIQQPVASAKLQTKFNGKKPTSKQKRKSKQEDLSVDVIKFTDIQQGFKDNGEKGAGSKIMEVIEHHNLMNVLIIATRWYSGTPIGSSRFRHIVNSSYDTLRKGSRL